MKRILFFVYFLSCISFAGITQNVFNPSDAIIRYDENQPLGSQQHPDPDKPGLQKWVSTPTIGVSVGTDTYDASSFKQYFINTGGGKVAFRLKFPKTYNDPGNDGKKYPVMLFLHGGGEVGCSTNGGIYNNEKQVWLGGSLFMQRVDNGQFDGFLLYPQLVVTEGCFSGWGTAPSVDFTAILGMIDSMVKYVRADNDRLLITGLSGGGYGAWRMADAYPQRVARIMPSAAAGSTTNRNNFVHIPIWFATGGQDPDPSPQQALYVYNRMKEIGSDTRYTVFPERGHSCWYQHWREPDFVAAMNDVHKANPLIFFQHNAFCVGETIDAKLGITQGFNAYQWDKDGVLIAERASGVDNIIDPTAVSSYTGNEINVKAYGTYRVRFKRTATSEWSEWSPKPAVVTTKTSTETPPITINGAHSKALPALDGSTTVPLMLPEGFIKYEWYHTTNDSLLDTLQVYNASVGVYKARYGEVFGCGTSFSPDFSVVDANGSPKPDPANTLTTVPVSESVIKLNWKQVASPQYNETGFEIYRSAAAGGPYTFVAITNTNIVTFQDTGLTANTLYFYVIRAVNETGASVASNESPSKTLGDNEPPTAPSNLQYRGSTKSTVGLSWNASTDNDGIDRYDVYANGVKMFSTKSTSFTATNLDSLTTYTFIVKAVDNAGNISSPGNQITGYTHRQGLNYKYYNGTWNALPNFDSLTPDKSGVMDTVSINSGIKTQSNGYSFFWDAYIYVPVAADYTFETYSGDGSKLYIDQIYNDSLQALVDNDGKHGVKSATGVITLTQGYHHIVVTYFQNSGGSDMQLFWSNNAGLSRQHIPKNFIAYEKVTLAGAPAQPGNPLAIAVAFDKVKLTWSDSSGVETGFEIVRSATLNGTYVPAGTANANDTSFTDSGLTALKTYYYKVRAIGAGGESGFTSPVFAITPIAPLTPVAPTQLAALPGTGNLVSLSWNDNAGNETSYGVYRSTDNINFTLIATLPVNTNAYTDTTAAALTEYYYYVAASNVAGTGEHSNTIKIRAGNNAPVIAGLSDIFVKSGETDVRSFTVTDDPGDSITVTILNKPSFVKLEKLTGNNYRITTSPAVENVGSSKITISAKDADGKESSVQITVFVSNKKTKTVYVNFGSNGKSAPQPWNNWLGIRAAGDVLNALKDENNSPTTIALSTVTAWTGLTNLGHITGNNSGIYPDAVLESGLSDSSHSSQIMISGLNPAKQYNIVLAGSQNEGIMATTVYSIGSQQSSLNARYNTNQSANLNNLVPDANGQLIITGSRTAESLLSYLNAMAIEEYDPSVSMLNPDHLYAEAIDRASVSLTWSDRTNNEAAADGYELKRATDSMFTKNITTIPLAANANSYIDAGLSPNTKYWYRVRAKNGAVYTEYSNRVKAITPSAIVYVNFNTTVANAPSPWNNLTTPPMSNFTTPPLKNQSGATTTMALTLNKEFNGEFTAGMNTGNNSGVVPDNVLMSNFWLDRGQLGQFKVSGLNHSKRYRFGFIGSSSPDGWFKGNYTATYNVNDRTVYLNSWQNTSKIVYIDEVSPDASGNALLNFSTTPTAGYGFNAGIIVEEYADPEEVISIVPPPVDTIINPPPPVDTIINPPPPVDTIINPPPPVDTIINPPPPVDTVPGIGNPPTDTIPDIDQLHGKVKVYPNPFASALNLNFNNTSQANKISVEMYDEYGRLLFRRNYEQLPPGNIILQMNSLESMLFRNGVYFVELKVNAKKVQTVKVVKLKK